ncbi:MAG: diguanylate cyclase [Myxococcota bacterium]
MNPYALLPLSGFLANCALAAAVFARNPRAQANRLYAMLALAIAYWSLLKFAWRLVGDAESAEILYRASAAGWCLLPSVYLHFVVAFTREGEPPRGPSRVRFAHAAGAGFAAAALVPGAMVVEMVREPWGYSHVPGPVYTLFTVYFIATFTGALVLLVRARSHARTKAVRAQCGYLIVGILPPLVGGVATNMLAKLAGIHVVDLAEVLSTFNAGVVGYAMVRHGLLAVTLAQALETIIATMGDALLVVNKTGEVVLSNAAAERMLRLSSADILGRPLSQFVRSRIVKGAIESALPGGLQVEEAEWLPKGGEPIPVMLSASAVRDREGTLFGVVCVAKDIREIRRAMLDLAAANQALERQAITDELTGVSNRRYANQRLGEECNRGWRYKRIFSIAVLDLDDFKPVNDTFGHQAGDRVLQVVAGVLRTALRTSDVVARWGGDEFFLLLQETDAPTAKMVCERVLAGIEGVVVPGVDLPIRASLGLATFEPAAPPQDADSLVKLADEALYQAKRQGKGRLAEASSLSVVSEGA